MVVLLLMFNLGCASNWGEDFCAGESIPYDAAGSPVLPDKVWLTLAEWKPTRVEWERSPTEETSTVDIAIGPGSGDPGLLEYPTKGCGFSGPVLQLPVDISVVVDGDAASTRFSSNVEAISENTDEIELSFGYSGEAEVRSDWQEAAIADPDQHIDVVPAGWGVTLTGKLSNAVLSIGWKNESDSLTKAVWSGTPK